MKRIKGSKEKKPFIGFLASTPVFFVWTAAILAICPNQETSLKSKPKKFVLDRPLKSPVGLRHGVSEEHVFKGREGREFKLWPGLHKEYWWQWEAVESRPNHARYNLLSGKLGTPRVDSPPKTPKTTGKVPMLYVAT